MRYIYYNLKRYIIFTLYKKIFIIYLKSIQLYIQIKEDEIHMN